MSPQQFISEYADSLAEWTINRVGAESIRTIFVGGSLAIDEVSAFDDDGFWEIYSDVDLYVVVQDGVDPVDIRARLSNPPTGDRESCRFLCPADVGVYSVEDLLQQPARPGTVFLGKHHKLLY